MNKKSTRCPPGEPTPNDFGAAGRPPSEYIYRGAMLVAALLLLWSANA